VIGGLEHYLKNLKKRGNSSDYIEAKTVECTPLAEVLEKGGFSPKDVDVLAVDVEGHDAKVVTEALKVPHFLPGMIIFEQKVFSALNPGELKALLDMLEQRGYSTDCSITVDGTRECADDVVATLKVPS
jgi:hypothetical protein